MRDSYVEGSRTHLMIFRDVRNELEMEVWFDIEQGGSKGGDGHADEQTCGVISDDSHRMVP